MLTRWNAVSTLDRMFDDVMGSAFGTAVSNRRFDPFIDVRTSDNEVVVMCDIPGVKKEDLEITLENRSLTIQGSRTFNGKPEENVVLGRAYGSFSRTFTLPDYLDGASLSAQLVDGVLSVRIPKQAKAKPRKIEIGGQQEPNHFKE